MITMDDDFSNDPTSELLERLWQCHLALTDPNEDQNHLEWFEERDAIRCELESRPDRDAAIEQWSAMLRERDV